jgi:hypothetical protein
MAAGCSYHQLDRVPRSYVWMLEWPMGQWFIPGKLVCRTMMWQQMWEWVQEQAVQLTVRHIPIHIQASAPGNMKASVSTKVWAQYLTQGMDLALWLYRKNGYQSAKTGWNQVKETGLLLKYSNQVLTHLHQYHLTHLKNEYTATLPTQSWQFDSIGLLPNKNRNNYVVLYADAATGLEFSL